MSGRYRGESRLLMLAGVILLVAYAYVWLIFFESRVESAAGAAVSVIPTIIGFLALAASGSLPCRFAADEKSLTISTGAVRHRYALGDIAEISCEYRRNTDFMTDVILSITDNGGRKSRFTEIHGVGYTELRYDANAKKPQLMQLCDYVKSVKGAET